MSDTPLFTYLGKPKGNAVVRCNICEFSMVRQSAAHHAKEHVAKGDAKLVHKTGNVEERYAAIAANATPDAVLVADHLLRFWQPVPESFDVARAAVRILVAAGCEIPEGPAERAMRDHQSTPPAPLPPSTSGDSSR